MNDLVLAYFNKLSHLHTVPATFFYLQKSLGSSSTLM